MTVSTRKRLPADLLQVLALGVVFIAAGIAIPQLVGSNPRDLIPSGDAPLFVRLLCSAFVLAGSGLIAFRLWKSHVHRAATSHNLAQYAWLSTGATVLCNLAGLAFLVTPPLLLIDLPLLERIAKSIPALITAIPCLGYGILCWGRRSIATWHALLRMPTVPGVAVWVTIRRAEPDCVSPATLHHTGWLAKIGDRQIPLLTTQPASSEQVPAILRQSGKTILLLTPSGALLGEASG